MTCLCKKCLPIFIALVGLLLLGRYGYFDYEPTRSLKPATNLSAFVHALPPVPLVFTSRTDISSFVASAPEAEGYKYPGTIPWAAREGRLRMLNTNGEVYELSWGKILPDGGTLIDVMSPSITLDGSSVLFAGRKSAPDAGRWRIYELELKTGNIKQRTGNSEDPGCTLFPPMRYSIEGTKLTEGQRKTIDYDDVDPSDLGSNSFVFASSRIPDQGRDHQIRATQIWLWKTNSKAPEALSANRNNDRWPIYTVGHLVTFSSWSRNREAVTEDFTEIEPVVSGKSYATRPTDNWMASQVSPNGGHLGYAIKSQEPVWRARPLFNGRLAFMTGLPSEPGHFRLAQADWGYIRSAPSSLPSGMTMPEVKEGAKLHFAMTSDSENRKLSSGCPSPAPGNRILFSGSAIPNSNGSYGLYSISDNWTDADLRPTLLFDDPDLEDSEPVAVYARDIKLFDHELDKLQASDKQPASIHLADGTDYSGPAGYLEDLSLRQPNRNTIPWADFSSPDRIQDPRRNVIPPPPNVTGIVIYAAHRDRFDDPIKPRIPGEWKKLLVTDAPGRDGSLNTWVPSDPTMTTVLAGLDEKGKIARWSSQSPVSAGRTFFAYAGDHYSSVRPNGYHHCVGCHTGHSFNPAEVREKIR
jgi:hypothetical protein